MDDIRDRFGSARGARPTSAPTATRSLTYSQGWFPDLEGVDGLQHLPGILVPVVFAAVHLLYRCGGSAGFSPTSQLSAAPRSDSGTLHAQTMQDACFCRNANDTYQTKNGRTVKIPERHSAQTPGKNLAGRFRTDNREGTLRAGLWCVRTTAGYFRLPAVLMLPTVRNIK
ncbi:hypothetical protein PHIN109289_06445 [Phaeobacter inhibens]